MVHDAGPVFELKSVAVVRTSVHVLELGLPEGIECEESGLLYPMTMSRWDKQLRVCSILYWTYSW